MRISEGEPIKECEEIIELKKKKITEKYKVIIEEYGLKQIFRDRYEKTFVSQYDFYARIKDLYVNDEGKYCVVWKYDPEPGGYGDQYMYLEAMTELTFVENADELTSEEILEIVEKGKLIEL